MVQVSVGGLPLFGVDADGCEWIVPKGGVNRWESPAPRLSTSDRARRHGVWVGDAFLQARTVTISGVVVAPSDAAADGAVDRLIAATGLEDVPVVVGTGAGERTVYARRSDEVLVTWHHYGPGGAAGAWSVQMLASDPRWLGSALSGSTGLPSVSGGLTVGVDQTLGTVPFAIEATVVSGQVTSTNPGTVAGPVVLRIDGPIEGPIVTHVNSGRSVAFSSSLQLGDGEWLVVDMDAHTVLAQGQEGASRAKWITGRGWSVFEPGVNVWTLSQSGSGVGGLLTVSARPAWM